MKWSSIKYLITSLILIILQVCVFNQINLFGYAVGFIFIYIILALPESISKNALYTIGFLTGAIIDIFSDTLGVNTISLTLLSALKSPVLKLYLSKKEELGSSYLTSKSIGSATFAKFSLSLSFLYCIFAFTLESFTFFNPIILIFRILGSTAFTFILMIAINTLNTRNEKRL